MAYIWDGGAPLAMSIDEAREFIKAEAKKRGYEAEWTRARGWSFYKGDTKVWYCSKGYAVAELIDDYYKNHRYYPHIKAALEDANGPLPLTEIKLTGMRGFKVGSLWEVEQVLQKLGIEWKRAIEMIFDREQGYYGYSVNRGVHVYFMIDEDTEVAYWTPTMHTLAILETPRKWSQDFLNRTEIVKELDK